ncbi:Detected protein of confused Function [Hibiscus syriacus]|uniref:Detected protein of confused Function n=1 Tax=Hibiscus syriacus TaxID=106335 RepID=A0A6A2Z5S4_HIBSY|nr:Detected protein of confused Function [Hibiscus syriacus]
MGDQLSDLRGWRVEWRNSTIKEYQLVNATGMILLNIFKNINWCSVLVDHVISEYQRGVNCSLIHNDSESEGAKILKILETSAETEVLMAEMSPELLTSFATYKSKLEESELVEGQAYAVSGLIPMNSGSEILYLQARGSTTKWKPLSPLAMESFEPFFCPQKSMKLSNLGESSLSSEFDIAAYVVYVGEVYTASHQKKQWVFVTDDSISDLQSGLSNSLLAISFCSPSIDDDSFAPINSNLVGSMVGFCNLIKKPKDQMNHLWVAEATENSAYHLNFNPSISHLKSAGASVQAWAKTSNSIINELRKKVLFVTGNCEG